MCKELIRRPRGMFLVTGPTGSGKTTSLATMIDFVNTNMDRHIVTMEDPIEYYHHHKKSIVNQREVGNDVPSFAEALRRVLRSDPDVILVGEMRDLETIEAAVRAAETGHLVFATLHTTGAAKTIDRIVDAFPQQQQNQIRVQLSTALICILSQVLLARVDVQGMVAGYEFLVVTPAIANLIRDNKSFRIDSSIQTGKRFGMQLLDDHLWSLYSRGMISAEEMIDKSKNPGELRDKVHRLGRTIGRAEWDIDDSDTGDAKPAKPAEAKPAKPA
jgi:twitching motility protein PilT